MKSLAEVGHVLWQAYVEPPANDPNVVGIGLGKDAVYIYTAKRVKGYPKEIDGVKIITRRVGRFKIGKP